MEEITDYLEDGYQDYLETIPIDKFIKYKSQIIEKLISNGDEKIFDYVNNKLKITWKEIETYWIDIVTKSSYKKFDNVNSIKLLENKFPDEFNILFVKQDSDKICDIIKKCSNEVFKYINIIIKDNVIPIKKDLLTLPSKFIDFETYIIVLEQFKTVNLTFIDKAKIMVSCLNNIENTSEKKMSLKKFIQLKKVLNINEKEFFDLIKYEIKTGSYSKKTFTSTLIYHGSVELINWIIEIAGIDVFLNNNNTKSIIDTCINNKNLETLKIIMNYISIFGYTFDAKDYEYILKMMIHNTWSYDSSEELIYYLIELGVEPPKNNKYYTYYKSIKIIN